MKHNTDLLNSINILEVAEKLNIEFNKIKDYNADTEQEGG